MQTTVFIGIVAIAVLIAVIGTFLVKRVTLDQMLVGNRSFGSWTLFFISAGEFYTIGTLVAFPSGVYAKGFSYAMWFLGYIVLAWPVAYFLAPYWNRVGRRYDAMTQADVFRRHFDSRTLEIVIFFVTFIGALFGAQYSFAGLSYAIAGAGIHISSTLTLIIASVLALLCVVFGGMRQQATLAPLKDALMMIAIFVVAVAAILVSTGGVGDIFDAAASTAVQRPAFVADSVPPSAFLFTLTTIIAQMVPAGGTGSQTAGTHAFTAKSERALKKQYVWFPLYMLMYPFLIIATYFAVDRLPHVKDPNSVFIVTAMRILPPWLVGLVAGAAFVSAIFVLAFGGLSLGGLISRNVVPDMPERRQRFWVRTGIMLFFCLSILLTLYTSPTLLVTILNLLYYVGVQLVPGTMAVFFMRGIRAVGVSAGLIGGTVLALGLYYGHVDTYGVNIGLISGVLNFVLMIVVSRTVHRGRTPLPATAWRSSRPARSGAPLPEESAG
ncbi:sodium:solute symporter family protein [Streptomyces sp. SID10853]|uniref:sodium:solute symporter family protein n=1 Tax=Streptomyces sp. SID10853 TaxID=2706028 RepID=UPI0013C21B2A|nr:sodium:solute symporter family protein [Streptomyces sp. SID10853]NDZ78481.1 sodium:solute symporter family protein [Streptomyces sp. SID10853]